MSFSDRGGVGYGFDPISGSVVSGSDNVQNARIDLVVLGKARSNKTPLFPTQDHQHTLAVPAFQGEFAFIYKQSDSFTDNNYRTSRARDSLDSGGWTETGDTVYYNTILNGHGDASMENEYSVHGTKAKEMAQLSYRSKIRVMGIVRDTVTNQDNTKTLGNTIVTSKGKITIINSGFDPIYAGTDVSWDILTSDKADSSGWAKCKLVEPGRLPLICAPTKTVGSALEEVVSQYEDELRNKNLSSSLKRLLRGALKISTCFDSQLLNMRNNLMKPADPSYDPFGTGNPRYFRQNPQEMFLTKALLSFDEEDLSGNDHQLLFGLNSTTYNNYLNTTAIRKDAFDFVCGGLVPGNKQMNDLNQPSQPAVFSSFHDLGLFDVCLGVTSAVTSSQHRRVGVAASDSIPGNKFDLIL